MYSKLISTLLGRQKCKDDLGDISLCRNGPSPADEIMADCQSVSVDHAHASLGYSHSSLVLAPYLSTEEVDCSYTDMRSHFALSWNIKYLGSFPISNTMPEYISSRLEKFSPSLYTKPVCLSVSLMGVRVHCNDNLVMSHSLRRVCSVIGRAQFKQVAYTAMEAAGQTYRRQCHVFQTEDLHQVEEIESVLGNAFQAALLTGQGTTLKPMAHNTPTNTPIISTTDKRPSSSAFLSRILGKGRDAIDDPKAKRRRRPVSAVFSSAIHRLSSSASVVNKRLTTIESPPHKESRQDKEHLVSNRINSLVQEEQISKNDKERISDNRPSSLIFDDKLNEWIYPVDDSTEAQLEQVNYFVKLPARELLVRNLLSRPEGAFVVRYSESKKKCLALSVRVPPTHNISCISHYLIIRNQNGYRIKSCEKYFPSLQMLITHHSVMPEKLPVALLFVQWNTLDWNPKQAYNYIVETCNSAYSKISDSDENRNFKFHHDQ